MPENQPGFLQRMLCHPRQPPPEQLQPCRLPVPSHPPVRALRCEPAACRRPPALARGVRADPRRGQQRAGWQQGGMGWADAVGRKGRLIFLSPTGFCTSQVPEARYRLVQCTVGVSAPACPIGAVCAYGVCGWKHTESYGITSGRKWSSNIC